MKIYAITVLHNEENRYLRGFLEHHKNAWDGWHILDDQSTDASFAICEEVLVGTNAVIERRPDDIPSFMQHEGEFRGYSWDRMVECFEPTVDDWIVIIDADEFMTPDSDLRGLLEEIDRDVDGLRVYVPEIHGKNGDGILLKRTDRYWDRTRALRVARYSEVGYSLKRHKPHACGVPDYSRNTITPPGITFLHLGYLSGTDKRAKYEKYKQNNYFGHNSTHIESILKAPYLQKTPYNIKDFLP